MDYLLLKDVVFNHHPADIAYSAAECFEVFQYFFESFRHYRGEEHPHMKAEQIQRLMRIMPYLDRERTGIADIDSNLYPELIEAYFRKRYHAGCDYHINHFFSGHIRQILLYETGNYN